MNRRARIKWSPYCMISRSRHPGGVAVALCDASVRFVVDDIDLITWRAASSIAQSEMEGLP
ncbi:MAG: H-X9-DG-CTERM domain-containing protein [Planctomycetaceae bacterium]